MTGIGMSLGVLAFALVLARGVVLFWQLMRRREAHSFWKLNQSSATFFHTRKSSFTHTAAEDNVAVACCHIAQLDGLRRGN